MIDSAVLEFQGIFPLAAIGAAAVASAAGASLGQAFATGVGAALLTEVTGGSKNAKSASKALPTRRLPSFLRFSSDD